MTKKVIKNKYLPAKLPLTSIACTYLLLDKFKAAEWVWGALGLFWLIIIIAVIVVIVGEKEYDIKLID